MLFYCFNNGRMAMTDIGNSNPCDQIEVFISGFIPNITALCFFKMKSVRFIRSLSKNLFKR